MATPQAAAQQYEAQQQLAITSAVAVKRLALRLGRQVGSFDSAWASVRADVLTVANAARLQAVQLALPYTSEVLAETGQPNDVTGALIASRFIAAAPDGRDFDSLLDTTPVEAKLAVRSGLSTQAAAERASRWLSGTLLTVLADTRRSVYSVDIARRPQITGYTRMLNPPSCGRCVILAGKWFRWNDGFLRHPRCDCIHIPAVENVAGDLTTDPYAYFNSLPEAEQNKLFGAGKVGISNARAVRDGGDIWRIENTRLRGLGTAKGKLRYGTPTRMTPDDIYRVAGTRTNAIKMLEQEGYITGPQKAGGNILGNGPQAERFAGMDRGRGFYPANGQQVKTVQASVVDARESGVRDPLNRHTMTSAERRLYDANYRYEYARQNGVLPRSIGQSSADVYSVERKVTAVELADLKAERDRLMMAARLGSSPSMNRLANALEGSGSGIPPSRLQLASSPDPEDWRARQRAVGVDPDVEEIDSHEIRFLERFQAAGHQTEWIYRDRLRRPTHDFYWLNQDGLAIELKRTKPHLEDSDAGSLYTRSTRLIRNSMRSALVHEHSLVKDHFILDLDDRPIPDGLLDMLAEYNARAARGEMKSPPLRRLWVWSQEQLVEVKLQ